MTEVKTVIGIITVILTFVAYFPETLFLYELNTLRHGLSLLALEQYNIVTWLYPASWTIANGLYSVMLLIRRKQLSKI